MSPLVTALVNLLRDGQVARICRKSLIVVLEIVLIALTYGLSFQLRFDFSLPFDVSLLLLRTVPVVIGIKVVAFQYFGLLRGWWRYAGLSDLVDITIASFASSVALGLFCLVLPNVGGIPLSVIGMDCLLTILVIGGARFAVRAYAETVERYVGERNTLIVGAGHEGASLVRDLKQDAEVGCNPVGIIDDDSSKLGIKIHGVKVVGTTKSLAEMIEKHNVKCVLIALPSPTNKQVQSIIDNCRSLKVEFKILPTLGNRINGAKVHGLLRNIKVEDLLGRPPVSLDIVAIRAKLQGKVVLITGAAGSIGSELARQVASFHPKRLVLLDRAENDQFRLSMQLSKEFPQTEHSTVVGDVLDVGLLRDLFAFHRPDSVFHAAAYKHVPVMESNCFQAVSNNVFGTYNVALIARQFRVEDFVLISTDKAVNPTNVMGVTKRICELLILALQQEGTRFVGVRFGNVLGSNGSVLPIFQQQIAEGGPVTITHPEVSRYFMTIPEAVQLVLQASTMGTGGEIFVLEMGEPIRIQDLAMNLIRLSGLRPETDINIVYTGLRPGEKMYEELCLSTEDAKPTTHDKIRVLNAGSGDFNRVRNWVDDLSSLVIAKNLGGLISKLKAIVPEYTPSEELLAKCDIDRHDFVLRHGMARAYLVAAAQEPAQVQAPAA